MPAAVFSLAFAAFAIGTTGFVIVGLLPDIGRAFASRCRRQVCW